VRFLITQLNGDREKFRLRYWLANIHISSHKKSFLLMKLLRTKISLYFYSKSLLLHHQCCLLLHILGTWSKLALALNRSSRTKLQRKWGRKQLLPENNKRSVCCQVNRSPLPTKKKRKFSLSFSAHPEASNAASLLPTTFETAKIVGSSAYRKYFCD